MILAVGKLIEVVKSHMAITAVVDIIGLEVGELLWIVSTTSDWQGIALRIETGELVHISSIDAITELPAYVEALR